MLYIQPSKVCPFGNSLRTPNSTNTLFRLTLLFSALLPETVSETTILHLSKLLDKVKISAPCPLRGNRQVSVLSMNKRRAFDKNRLCGFLCHIWIGILVQNPSCGYPKSCLVISYPDHSRILVELCQYSKNSVYVLQNVILAELSGSLKSCKPYFFSLLFPLHFALSGMEIRITFFLKFLLMSNKCIYLWGTVRYFDGMYIM